MSQPTYLEILKKRNPGVYIEEKDFSIYNITRFFNRFTLVVGVSKEGPVNLPVLVVSPENFEQVFGKHDYSLERKGSYFHRTVKEMLSEGAVICVNLRLFDSIQDKYNWQTLSTSSDVFNSNRRSNPICDFFNLNDGFWRRSSKQLNEVAKNNLPDSNLKPLTFVNQGSKPVSILAFKSDIKGFDVTVEDWYGVGNYPLYLHPKDYISDYMIQVVAVEGDWNNYRELSVHPTWGKYFDKSGIKKDKLDDFYNEIGVRMIKRWQCCLIPYFNDKKGNDMYIETVINDDINESGILCSYDIDVIETEFKNGLIDINGDNLTDNKIPEIDFLSYKRYLTDFLVLSETLLDSPNNSFGHHKFNAEGRTQIYAEGYVHNTKLKSVIISSTSTVEIKPFDASNDAYGVINGKVIDINSDIGTTLALHETVTIGNHIVFLILLTSNGIEFRLGSETPLDQNLYLPHIDGKEEIVLGYYDISQDLLGNYDTDFFPVTIDEDGFINPFRIDGDTNTDPMIIFEDTGYDWVQQIVFENIKISNPQNYKQQRISHLWYWLSNNFYENQSLVIDTNNLKQEVDWLEQGSDNVNKWIKIAVKDKTSDILSTSGTNGMIGYYMKDIEFLSKNDIWKQSLPPLSFSSSGIIGYDSFISEAYYAGEINSGDPFFWGISEEYDVMFKFDPILNQNLILVPDIISDDLYVDKKVIIENTIHNNGIWNFLNVIPYGQGHAIIVEDKVIEEEVDKIRIFDADIPLIINLYTIGGETHAMVEKWDGEPEELYRRLKEKEEEAQWAKTLEIERFVESNKIVVDINRYSSSLELGYFLLGDNKNLTDEPDEQTRNWTRIIDLQKVNDTELLVITDAPIKYREFENDAQTDILRPIHDWVDTLDFKILKPFIPRKESFPDGSEEKQNEILNMIAKGTKMHSSLTGDKFEWRYLVDSFGNGMIPNSKHQLAQLAESKQFALSFINVPSIKQFRKDGTKYLTNGSFDTQKLLSGGDRKNNTGSSYSITDVGNTHAVYLSPYVSKFERGRFFNLPPATEIGKLFMSKHNDKNVKAWDVIAGIDKAQLRSIANLEEKFSEESLIDLHDFGITTIHNYKGIIYYINNQRTAVQEESVLRFTHNREALIELELTMYKELRKYQWSFFGGDLKEKIEETANSICEFYKRGDAISTYRNIFTATDEMKDAQIGLISTYVEMSGVMETIILQMSVLRTGGVAKLFG